MVKTGKIEALQDDDGMKFHDKILLKVNKYNYQNPFQK
jgi:hypothetical protein